jgi:hypothetical protein
LRNTHEDSLESAEDIKRHRKVSESSSEDERHWNRKAIRKLKKALEAKGRIATKHLGVSSDISEEEEERLVVDESELESVDGESWKTRKEKYMDNTEGMELHSQVASLQNLLKRRKRGVLD